MRPALSDPDDELVLDLAIQCGGVIVTYNKRDFVEAGKRRPCSGARRIPRPDQTNRMTVSVNIPEELYRRAREIAESQHLSVDDVVSSAFAEQLSAWERLKRRAARGSRKSFGRTGQSA